ncbi:hypothetical protein MBLNU457_6499t1 [Dothideomycetes sp. NU457]
MGIFSKKKESAKGKTAAATEEPQTPKERPMYLPRYAARDGLIGAPSGGYREEEQEAFQRAYNLRMSRQMNESSWSLNSPRMSPRLSRNSSAMSLDYHMAGNSSRPSPFLSQRPASYQSLPQLLSPESPPVPQIPQQYAPFATSPMSQSRNSSFQNQYNQFGSQQAGPSNNYLSAKPRVQSRQSFTSALGKTPEASNENTPVIDQQHFGGDDSVNHSSSASTASSASGEAIEIPRKADSPAQYILDRDYPNDPRKYDSGATTPRSYFGHSSKPEVAQIAQPVAVPPPTKKRFSFKRSAAVAAH